MLLIMAPFLTACILTILIFELFVYDHRTTSCLALYKPWIMKVFRVKDNYIYMHVPMVKRFTMLSKGRIGRIKEFYKSMVTILSTLEKGKVYKIRTHSKIYKRLLRASSKGLLNILSVKELKYKNIKKIARFHSDFAVRAMIFNFDDLIDKQRKYYIITFEVI